MAESLFEIFYASVYGNGHLILYFTTAEHRLAATNYDLLDRSLNVINTLHFASSCKPKLDLRWVQLKLILQELHQHLVGIWQSVSLDGSLT